MDKLEIFDWNITEEIANTVVLALSDLKLNAQQSKLRDSIIADLHNQYNRALEQNKLKKMSKKGTKLVPKNGK